MCFIGFRSQTARIFYAISLKRQMPPPPEDLTLPLPPEKFRISQILFKFINHQSSIKFFIKFFKSWPVPFLQFWPVHNPVGLSTTRSSRNQKVKQLKSEARNPKSETNSKSKCSKFKTKKFSTWVTKYNPGEM
jgi:hypothetical protein